MSAILPPAERLWWKHPIDRVEGTWIAIAFVWCMIMFFMMVGWHIYGNQNLSTETYKTTPDAFAAKAQVMVDKYTVRSETDAETPVVAPPAGSDVYLIARLWNFWPILELDGHAQPERNVLGGLQRILRDWPSHDGRPHLRQVRGAQCRTQPPIGPVRGPACSSRRKRKS